MVFWVSFLLSSFNGNPAALVDVFFAENPFETYQLILAAVIYEQDLKSTEPVCSETKTKKRKCDLYWNDDHLNLTGCADDKLIEWCNSMLTGEDRIDFIKRDYSFRSRI